MGFKELLMCGLLEFHLRSLRGYWAFKIGLHQAIDNRIEL